jgi:hypothetical protein
MVLSRSYDWKIKRTRGIVVRLVREMRENI